jgi:putative transposase
MPTLRTPFFPNTVYHVVHHGNAFDDIFYRPDNYDFFLQKYKQYISPIANTFAYCLMPNHFHIGLKIKPIDELKYAFATHAGIRKYQNAAYTPEQITAKISEITDESLDLRIATQFAHFLNAYAKAINKQEDRKGSLFLDSIKAEHVDNAAYYRNMVRYIHNNPVKHGFCEKATDWAHSSIHAFNSVKFSQLERNEVMDWFGGAEAFWDFHALDNESDVFQFFDI